MEELNEENKCIKNDINNKEVNNNNDVDEINNSHTNNINNDNDNLNSIFINHTQEEIADIIEKTTDIKNQANAYYKEKQYIQAINNYTTAINLFISNYSNDMPVQYISSSLNHNTNNNINISNLLTQESNKTISKMLSVLFLNTGLCFKQLKETDKAIDNFSKSILFDNDNTKALYQRLDVNYNKQEYLDALEDYNRLKILNSKLLSEFKVSEHVLKNLAEKKKQEMTGEMLGKLKDVGNSFLGLFGLSTNNFQFNQQPGGGYNIQFKNNN